MLGLRKSPFDFLQWHKWQFWQNFCHFCHFCHVKKQNISTKFGRSRFSFFIGAPTQLVKQWWVERRPCFNESAIQSARPMCRTRTLVVRYIFLICLLIINLPIPYTHRGHPMVNSIFIEADDQFLSRHTSPLNPFIYAACIGVVLGY